MPRSRVPEIPDGLEWFNVDGPVSLPDQAGRVLLLDFGNFSSMQGRRVLSDLQYLAGKFRDRLVVVTIHTPRFPREKDSAHVNKAINRHQLDHPLVHDPGKTVSKAYGIRQWPTQVLVDREGYILCALSGAGNLSKLEQIIDYQLSRQDSARIAAADAIDLRRSPEPASVLSFPGKIVASDSKLYIADSGNNRILVASKSGNVLRQYGGGVAGFIDGDSTTAAFSNPQGMVLVDQYLYVADAGNHAIRRIHTRSNDVITIAGTGRQGMTAGSGMADPLQTDMNTPSDFAFRRGMLYIAMAGLHQVWCLSLLSNRLAVFAGSGREGLVNGTPGKAAFAQPAGLAILGDSLYTADAGTSAIRSIDLATGLVRTLAGTGEYGDTDGEMSAARFQYPLGIEADPGRKLLWVIDTYNNKIRKISINNQMVSSLSSKLALDEPGGLAFQGDTLYIANTNRHEVLRVNPENSHAEALNVSEEFAEI